MGRDRSLIGAATTSLQRTRTQTCWSTGRGRLFGARRKLKARDAVILQDRDVDVRDVRVRQNHQPIVACGKPRPGLDRADMQSIEPLSAERHDLDAHAFIAVVLAEPLNQLSEFFAEEVHVEHAERDANRRARLCPHTRQFGRSTIWSADLDRTSSYFAYPGAYT